jgi:hypothetical protein
VVETSHHEEDKVMKKKLKLSLDDIRIESFDTTGSPKDEAGTVHARTDQDTDCMAWSCVTNCVFGCYTQAIHITDCGPTCEGSCITNCDSCGCPPGTQAAGCSNHTCWACTQSCGSETPNDCTSYNGCELC